MLYEGTYGTNEPGTPYRDEGTWFRVDTWTSRRTGEVFRERRFAGGPRDTSDAYHGKYDPRCSCCWLNFSHTEDCHTRRAL